jgi:hypothetical protein
MGRFKIQIYYLVGVIFASSNLYANSPVLEVAARRLEYCSFQLKSLSHIQNPHPAHIANRNYIRHLEVGAYQLTRDLISLDAVLDIRRELMSDDGPKNTHIVRDAFKQIIDLDPQFESKVNHLKSVQTALKNLDFAKVITDPSKLDVPTLNPWKDHPILGPFTNPDLNVGYKQVKLMEEDSSGLLQADVYQVMDLASALMALKAYMPSYIETAAQFTKMELRAEIFIALTFKKLGDNGVRALYQILDGTREPTTLTSALQLVYLVENLYPGYLKRADRRELTARITNFLTFPDDDGKIGVRVMALFILLKARSLDVAMNKTAHETAAHPLNQIAPILRDVLLEYRDQQRQNKSKSVVPRFASALYFDIIKSLPETERNEADMALAQEVFLNGQPDAFEDDGSDNPGPLVKNGIEHITRMMSIQTLIYLGIQHDVFEQLKILDEFSLKEQFARFGMDGLTSLIKGKETSH